MILLSELLKKQFPPEAHLVGAGLLNNNSILVIGGPPKLGKSLALATMLLQLAAGKPLFGVSKTIDHHSNREWTFPVAKPCRILLFEQEVGEMDMQERISGMLKHVDPDDQKLVGENFAIHSTDRACRLDTPEGFDRMAVLIKAFKPDIVAIDPLKEYHYAAENDAQGMSIVFQRVLKLKDELKFALIISHHTSKPSKDSNREGPDELRGSSYLFGLGDTFLIFKPDGRKNGKIRVDTTLRRGKPISDFNLQISPETLFVEFGGWRKGRDSNNEMGEMNAEDIAWVRSQRKQ
jgi:hypothetical protein